jgi:hypothetical protein
VLKHGSETFLKNYFTIKNIDMIGRIITIALCLIIWLICHFIIKKLPPGDFGPQGGFIPFCIQVLVILVGIVMIIITLIKLFK